MTETCEQQLALAATSEEKTAFVCEANGYSDSYPRQTSASTSASLLAALGCTAIGHAVLQFAGVLPGIFRAKRPREQPRVTTEFVLPVRLFCMLTTTTSGTQRTTHVTSNALRDRTRPDMEVQQ